MSHGELCEISFQPIELARAKGMAYLITDQRSAGANL